MIYESLQGPARVKIDLVLGQHPGPLCVHCGQDRVVVCEGIGGGGGGLVYYGRDRASTDRPQSAAQIKAHSVPSVHSSQASEINPNPNICIR